MKNENFWNFVKIGKENECWEWQAGRNDRNYGRVHIGGRQEKAHRVAYRLTYGEPGLLKVCHSCDNPPCCNPSHLFLGTQKDNILDMVRKGRHKSNFPHLTGENAAFVKLKNKDVLKIKELLKTEKVTKIARMFNVNHSLICQIKTGKIWKEI